MDLLGLFFIGVPVSLVVLYIILKNLDSNSIFLTNKQYLPIKNYIENYNSNDNFKEFLDFKNKWFIRYCNIENIFNLW